MEESRVAEPVGYHLSFEDGRDDPDGNHRQGTVGSSPDGRVNL